MSYGKELCKILREIRKATAEKYGLEYNPAECHNEGDCKGTCPVCDKEVMDLQRQLDEKGIHLDNLPSNESLLDGGLSGLGNISYKQIEDREVGRPIAETGFVAPVDDSPEETPIPSDQLSDGSVETVEESKLIICLKSGLAIITSTAICSLIVYAIVAIMLAVNADGYIAFVLFLLSGFLAGSLCELAARLYEKHSKDRLRDRWIYLWRVVYAAFIMFDIYACIFLFLIY